MTGLGIANGVVLYVDSPTDPNTHQRGSCRLTTALGGSACLSICETFIFEHLIDQIWKLHLLHGRRAKNAFQSYVTESLGLCYLMGERVQGEPQVGRDCKGESCSRAGLGNRELGVLTAQPVALCQHNRTMPALAVKAYCGASCSTVGLQARALQRRLGMATGGLPWRPGSEPQ